jgi:tetratricopeptide (TPR) repeat protein
LNVQGEAAYRRGDYQQAVQLFQAAIAIDDNYGQAYSNLGLVFQKTGRVAEALWANRKAIALASGPNAATTRASTHFNNGRIYEDKEQWSDALREYRAAQAEKSNSVYQNAIARAEQHGAQ